MVSSPDQLGAVFSHWRLGSSLLAAKATSLNGTQNSAVSSGELGIVEVKAISRWPRKIICSSVPAVLERRTTSILGWRFLKIASREERMLAESPVIPPTLSGVSSFDFEPFEIALRVFGTAPVSARHALRTQALHQSARFLSPCG